MREVYVCACACMCVCMYVCDFYLCKGAYWIETKPTKKGYRQALDKVYPILELDHTKFRMCVCVGLWLCIFIIITLCMCVNVCV